MQCKMKSTEQENKHEIGKSRNRERNERKKSPQTMNIGEKRIMKIVESNARTLNTGRK